MNTKDCKLNKKENLTWKKDLSGTSGIPGSISWTQQHAGCVLPGNSTSLCAAPLPYLPLQPKPLLLR